MRRVCATFLLLLLAAASQQVGENTTARSTGAATFQTSTQLVVETVSVKDKSGTPVEGLTAKDFTVTEDGAPETIRFFEFERLPEAPRSADVGPPAPGVAALAKLPKTRIAPEPPGSVKYRDRRLLALYFDMSAMPVGDQLRALTAAQKFIRTQLTPADLVCLLMYDGGGVQVLEDFTDDRDRLESIIATMIVGEDQNSGDTTGDASSADTGAGGGPGV